MSQSRPENLIHPPGEPAGVFELFRTGPIPRQFRQCQIMLHWVVVCQQGEHAPGFDGDEVVRRPVVRGWVERYAFADSLPMNASRLLSAINNAHTILAES